MDAAAIETIPGLVAADGLPRDVDATALQAWDPVFALQVLPSVVTVHAPSINRLAAAVADHLAGPIDGIAAQWLLHVLVPGMFKGQPKPALQRRASLVAQAVGKRLGRTRRRAWKQRRPTHPRPTLIAQMLLRDAENLWLSIAPTIPLPTGATWPSPLPAGLAAVADDPLAPSSAFRKLEEAFACMGRWPGLGDTAVDLGAAPGGWSRVLLRYRADVIAVDRSPLAASLMADPKMNWLRGDAFKFRPHEPVDWLVSDVAAYPERVVELLDVWCGGKQARSMVVQMKFKGATDWAALDEALAVALRHGFAARARHFFNDKNEVTLMVAPL